MEDQMRSISVRKILIPPALACIAILLFAIFAAAQTTSGSLACLMKDAQGAAIPGAQIQITSTSRKETRTTQSDQDGRFVFPQLTPDTYTLQIEAKGFKGYKLESLVVNANDKISAPE